MVILTREQLEERLAALHEAGLELVRDLSIDHVLKRIVNLAREQVGAKYAALGVLDEDENMVRFIPVGMTREEIRKTGNVPEGKGMIGAIQNERRTIRVSSIGEDERSSGFPTQHPQMDSFLGVPILLGDQLLGQIYLTDKENYPEFTETDEKVIEMLAAYAAIAISNARLYGDVLVRDKALTQRNEDLALLNDMAADLTKSLEVDEIVARALKRAMDYLDVEAGEIYLSESGSKTMRLALHRGEAGAAFWSRDRFKPGEGIVGTVAETGKPLLSAELAKDTHFLRPAVIEAGFRCMVCVPLMARENVVGVMCVASRQVQHMDNRVVNMLVSIGAWAGITIENALLHRSARRLAVMEERERIGMDLHDGIIQSIYAVGLALDYARYAVEDNPDMALGKIEQAIDGLNNAIRDIRSYILDLRPRQLRGEDLISGLHRLLHEFRANSNTEVKLVVSDDILTDLPPDNASTLFHICQEALANIAKHARADKAEVRLWTTSERVLLEILDDGKGFSPREKDATIGHGLSNMQTRAHRVGGEMEVNSDSGKGTTVLAWVPRKE